MINDLGGRRLGLLYDSFPIHRRCFKRQQITVCAGVDVLVVFFLGQDFLDVGLLQIAVVVGQTTVDECSKKSLEM